MAWYNPYGYGYGGVGYVQQPTTQQSAYASPVRPVVGKDGGGRDRPVTPGRAPAKFDMSAVPESATAEQVVNDYSPYAGMGGARKAIGVAGLAAPPGIGAIASALFGAAERSALNDIRGNYGLSPLGPGAIIGGMIPFAPSMQQRTINDIRMSDIFGRNFGARMEAQGISDPFGVATPGGMTQSEAAARGQMSGGTDRTYGSAGGMTKSEADARGMMSGGTDPTKGNEGGDDGGDGCFITTSVCRALGEPDDGPTLSTLRWFRDNILMRSEGGKKDVEEYYRIAPDIVSSLEAKENSDAIMKDLNDRYIQPAISAINVGEYERAHDIYRNMVDHTKMLTN